MKAADPATLAGCAPGDRVLLAVPARLGGTDRSSTLPIGTLVRVAWQGQISTFVEIWEHGRWSRPTPAASNARIASFVERPTEERTSADSNAGGESVDPVQRGAVAVDTSPLFGGRS